MSLSKLLIGAAFLLPFCFFLSEIGSIFSQETVHVKEIQYLFDSSLSQKV